MLKFAVKDFLEDREYQNFSKSTIQLYRDTLKQFQEYVSRENIVDVDDVTPATIKGFMIYLKKERKNNPVSMNLKLRNLRAFFNYLIENDFLKSKKNPASQIPMLKTDVKIEVLTDEQIRKMLSYFRRRKQREFSFVSYRDYMIIVFLLGTGVRLGEMVNLRWDEMDFIHLKITVFGKKRVSSSIPLTEKLAKELGEYRIFQTQYFKREIEWVFPNMEGKKLTENAVKLMFKRLSNVMNFRVHAHLFRHTYAHRCIMAGMDVFSLQKILRHSRLDTTMRYVAMWGTALKEQNEKFNPLNNLDI